MLLRPSAQRATSDSVLLQRAPSPLRRIGVRVAAVLTACGSLLVVAGGCDGFNAAKGAVDTTNASVQSTKATGDAVKGTGDALKGEVDKARGKKDDKGGGGGEKKEDDDDTRIKAIKTSLDQPVNDQLKVADNDIVDWKSWDLSNIRARSWVVFELNWDEPSAELNLDVYDQVGQQVVQSPGRSGVPSKKIPLRVDTPGYYYARIRALGEKDQTVYTVVLRTTPGGKLRKPKDKGDKPAAGAGDAGGAGGAAGGAGGAAGGAGGAAGGAGGAAGGAGGAGGAQGGMQGGGMQGGMQGGGMQGGGMQGGGMQGGMMGGGMQGGGMQGGMMGGGMQGGGMQGGMMGGGMQGGMMGGGMQGGMQGGGMQGGMGGGMQGGMQGGMGGGMQGGMQGGMGGGMQGGGQNGAAQIQPIPPGAITGNIVQSFQEDDGKTYVYLDKGSAAKLRLNMKGTILLGKEGGQPMDGGSITIVKILGESQAKAVLDNGRSPGRNTRFMFQAKK